MIHQSWFVVWWCVGVIFGAILALVFRINYFGSFWWICFAVGLLVFAFIKPRATFIIFAFLSGMVMIFFRTAMELEGEDYIRQFFGQTVVVNGVISGDPEMDDGSTKYKLVDLKFGENGEYETRGNLFISGMKNSKLKRSDRVTLRGKMSEGFGTYAGYMYKPEMVKWERPEPGDLILKVRNWFAERINKLVPEPENKLGLSYLLGMKSGLPDELAENLRTVGLVHIVVASGAHLSILVEIARKIFGKISRFAGLMFSVIFILFFMAMVGWTPSIMRAGIMAMLTLITWYVGRKIAPLRMIIMVMAVTLMMEPMFLINLGWLLSFASFAGIMLIGPELTRIFYGKKKLGFIAETVIATLSATIMTLPVTLYYYGTVSLISVIANLLILPTLSYAMGLVFLAGVVAGIPGVEIVVGWCTTKLLDFHIAVVEFFGNMREFLITIPPYQSWVFLIYIFIVGPLLYIWWKKHRQNKSYAIMRT